MGDVRVGEIWYVKFKNARQLSSVKVKKITNTYIVVKFAGLKEVYKLGDLEFVGLV